MHETAPQFTIVGITVDRGRSWFEAQQWVVGTNYHCRFNPSQTPIRFIWGMVGGFEHCPPPPPPLPLHSTSLLMPPFTNKTQSVTYSQGQQVLCSLHSPPHRSRCSTVFPALARAAANTLCTNPETKTQLHALPLCSPYTAMPYIFTHTVRPSLPVPSTTTSNSDGSWSCGRCAMFSMPAHSKNTRVQLAQD